MNKNCEPHKGVEGIFQITFSFNVQQQPQSVQLPGHGGVYYRITVLAWVKSVTSTIRGAYKLDKVFRATCCLIYQTRVECWPWKEHFFDFMTEEIQEENIRNFAIKSPEQLLVLSLCLIVKDILWTGSQFGDNVALFVDCLHGQVPFNLVTPVSSKVEEIQVTKCDSRKRQTSITLWCNFRNFGVKWSLAIKYDTRVNLKEAITRA